MMAVTSFLYIHLCTPFQVRVHMWKGLFYRPQPSFTSVPTVLISRVQFEHMWHMTGICRLWKVMEHLQRGVCVCVCLTSFCSTCSADLRTSLNWVSCFLSSSCTCFIFCQIQIEEIGETEQIRRVYVAYVMWVASVTRANKIKEELLCFPHCVEISGQFFYGRFQVVNSFQTILEEAEQKQKDFHTAQTPYHHRAAVK